MCNHGNLVIYVDDGEDIRNHGDHNEMVVTIRIDRTAKHGSTTLSNLLLKINASQELNGTQVLQINHTLLHLPVLKAL